MNPPCPATIGLLFSGGVDSTVLLVHLLRGGQAVQPIYVSCDTCWEEAELAAARQLLRTLRSDWKTQLRKLLTLKLPVDDLYGNHWSMTGQGVPPAGSDDAAVSLPGRNPLLLVKAALWCQLNQIPQLALGTLAGNPFPDAQQDFFAALAQSLQLATGTAVRLLRPFSGMTKQQVLQLAAGVPLDLTFSCIAPVGGAHCRRCNKCDERQRALSSSEPTTEQTTRWVSCAAQPSGECP